MSRLVGDGGKAAGTQIPTAEAERSICKHAAHPTLTHYAFAAVRVSVEAVGRFSLTQKIAGYTLELGAEGPPSKTCSFCQTNDIFKL